MGDWGSGGVHANSVRKSAITISSSVLPKPFVLTRLWLEATVIGTVIAFPAQQYDCLIELLYFGSYTIIYNLYCVCIHVCTYLNKIRCSVSDYWHDKHDPLYLHRTIECLKRISMSFYLNLTAALCSQIHMAVSSLASQWVKVVWCTLSLIPCPLD